MQLAKTAASNIYPNTREGSLRIDTTGSILTFNKQAETLFSPMHLAIGGNLLSEHFLFCETTSDTIDIPTQTPWLVTLNSGLAQEDIVLGIHQKNGTNRWLSFSSEKVNTKEGIYVLITFFDVSKLVQQNIQLIAKEQQLNLLVSSLNDIIFEITQDGDLINYWTNNDNLLFLPPNIFLGKNLKDILPESVTTRSLQLISKTLTTGIEQEMDFLSPFESHKNCWYHLLIKSIAKSSDSVAVIISDITEEVENRANIKLNENKFNQAFHFSAVGMSLTGLDGYCLDANKTLCQILGYTKNELLTINFADVTHPNDIQRDLELRKKTLDGEIDSFTFEKRYQHKSGHYIWCNLTVSLVRNHKNYPKFYIAQIHDIAQAKQNIEILEKQKTELEVIKLDLETKIRQLEDFNQIVTHNLKGPVCNIQTLIHEIDNETNPTRKKTYLSLLKTSGEELTNSLDELTMALELKIEHKHALEKCHFHSIIEKALKKHKAEIAYKKAQITTHLAIDHILYPNSLLEQTLDILLNNALKFTQLGRQPKIEISTYLHQEKTYLKVSDNGIGIDLSLFKSQVFMFKKVFHRGYESRGIGLFTCRYLVENAGGKIEIDSEPGVGSSFLIQF